MNSINHIEFICYSKITQEIQKRKMCDNKASMLSKCDMFKYCVIHFDIYFDKAFIYIVYDFACLLNCYTILYICLIYSLILPQCCLIDTVNNIERRPTKSSAQNQVFQNSASWNGKCRAQVAWLVHGRKHMAVSIHLPKEC